MNFVLLLNKKEDIFNNMELMVTTDLVDNGKKENTIDVYGAHQLFCN